MPDKKTILGVSVNVLVLGFVSLLNDFSSEMIMPILPMFLTSLGATGIIIGIVGGLRDCIASVFFVIGGFLADRTGKKKVFVTTGYFASALCKVFLALSTIWEQALIFAGIERIGKGLRTAPREAIIAESMEEEKGKGFGVDRAMDTTGAVLGSIAAFVLFWYLGFGFAAIILTAAAFGFFSLLPLKFVKDVQKKPQPLAKIKIGMKDFSRPLKAFIIVSCIFALANFSYMFFILKAQMLFEEKTAMAMAILLYVLFNIFYAIFAIPFGALSDKIGRRKVILAGYLLFGAVSIGFLFAHSFVQFIPLFALYGIAFSIIKGNERAYVSDLSAEDVRATALGTFHTLVGLTALPASIIAGILWQFYGPAATFVYGAAMAIFAAIMLEIVRMKYHTNYRLNHAGRIGN